MFVKESPRCNPGGRWGTTQGIFINHTFRHFEGGEFWSSVFEMVQIVY